MEVINKLRYPELFKGTKRRGRGMQIRQASSHRLEQRGGAVVKRIKIIEKPNIVETYQYGNTTIHIADNCIVKTPEEAAQVIRDLYAVAWRIYLNSQDESN